MWNEQDILKLRLKEDEIIKDGKPQGEREV